MKALLAALLILSLLALCAAVPLLVADTVDAALNQQAAQATADYGRQQWQAQMTAIPQEK